MIGTEFLKGQGLGNQLFCYVSARCIAKALGYDFGTAGQEQLAVNIHSKKGMYFMDMDLGIPIDNIEKFHKYQEAEKRLYIKNCAHDMRHGCYVAGADSNIYSISDHTLIYGNLQAERYFITYKEEIKDWLKVKAEYNTYEFTKDNLCIMNVRGGEYVDNRSLFLKRKYWLDAMINMQKIRPDMEFMIITDDVGAAGKLLPEVKAYHFDLDKDYVTIKNAKYLILSNSSFAFFPAFTSETVEKIIAPKYWARHNVSDGYWASEQNIYSEFIYQDRKGDLFTAKECLEELEEYKREGNAYLQLDMYEVGAVNRRVQLDRLLYWMDKVKSRLEGKNNG